MRFSSPLHAALVGTLVLAGCGREPTGQVAAVIGDDEVTLQEINAEVGDAQVPKGVDPKVVRQAALQRIVERRLLADVARDQELDKKPEFLIRERQLDDALLVQLLGEQTGRSIKVPDAAGLDKYIAAHPASFAERELFTLDQVRFPTPADPTKLRAIEQDHSLEAVVNRLNGLGIKFERGAAGLDSMRVPPETLKQIKALPAGEPFVIPQGNLVTVSAIVSSRPAPFSGAEARPLAVQMYRNEELTKVLEQRLKAKKTEVAVKYQPGFEPPKPGKPAEKAGAPAAR